MTLTNKENKFDKIESDKIESDKIESDKIESSKNKSSKNKSVKKKSNKNVIISTDNQVPKIKCNICIQEGQVECYCKIIAEVTELKIEEKNNIINTTPKKEVVSKDTYTEKVLKEQYTIHKSYVKSRKETTKKLGVNVRLPSIPEDISENIVKFIIHNKLNDKTSSWDCKKGDLYSEKEGKQECKCFTSDGPLSFTPTSEWDVIYFLDARSWLDDKFKLYKIILKRTSDEWKNIKVNKTQTFGDQCKEKRRPRLIWEALKLQILSHCIIVYEGSFDDIFIPLEVKE
jgi:hypothetical protein